LRISPLIIWVSAVPWELRHHVGRKLRDRTGPTRYRFLRRNRVNAALAAVTHVVEALWCFSALNAVHHAETITRHVAAVPGSAHGANSAGCYRLLKEGGVYS
jgi:predicted Rossmann fold nucleotide-binding protein DprA/Smf involved in DNA uptake